MRNIGTHGYMYCICRLLSMSLSDSLSSIWAIQCALQNFLCYNQKTTVPKVSPNIKQMYGKYCDQGEIQAIIFLAVCQN